MDVPVSEEFNFKHSDMGFLNIKLRLLEYFQVTFNLMYKYYNIITKNVIQIEKIIIHLGNIEIYIN